MRMFVSQKWQKFIAFTFQDTSGTIDGKFWDASEEEINRFEAGKVVLLDGKREVYQGNPKSRFCICVWQNQKNLMTRASTWKEPSEKRRHGRGN